MIRCTNCIFRWQLKKTTFVTDFLTPSNLFIPLLSRTLLIDGCSQSHHRPGWLAGWDWDETCDVRRSKHLFLAHHLPNALLVFFLNSWRQESEMHIITLLIQRPSSAFFTDCHPDRVEDFCNILKIVHKGRHSWGPLEIFYDSCYILQSTWYGLKRDLHSRRRCTPCPYKNANNHSIQWQEGQEQE